MSLKNIDGKYRDRCTGLYSTYVHPLAQSCAFAEGLKCADLSKVDAMQLHIKYLFGGTLINEKKTD